jgi:hypothetical protein
VARAQELIASGHGIVVDLDLEKFFDRQPRHSDGAGVQADDRRAYRLPDA